MEPGSIVNMENWPVVEVARHGHIPVHPHVADLIEKNKREACPQRTPEWYEKRRNHLTASSIASAVGENPYDSRMSAVRKKIGLGPAFKGNAATEHGNHYEDIAVGIYEERTGEKQIEFGLLESIKTTHNGEPVDTSFLAGSPDGITASGRLLECKCPYRRKPTGKVPNMYMHQIQGLMHMLDLPICDFFEYIPEAEWQKEVFIITTVLRSDIYWENTFRKMQDFWSDVVFYRNEIEEKGEDHVDEITKPKKRPRKKTVPKEKPATICLPDFIPEMSLEQPKDGISLNDMVVMKQKGTFKSWDFGNFVKNIEEKAERILSLEDELTEGHFDENGLVDIPTSIEIDLFN